MTEEEKKELDEASDFNQMTFKRYPTIKFTSGTKSDYSEAGTFTLLASDAEGNLKVEDLGKEIKVVFLKRGKFRLKNADYNTRDIMFSKDKEITLYGKSSKGKQMVATVGSWKDLKEQYGLKAFQYPYVALEDGRIARLGILPSSLNNYWEYCDSFKNAERIYEFYTIVKAAPELTQGKKGSYYLMNFIRGNALEPEEFDGVAVMIRDLREELQKAELSYQEAQEEYDKIDRQEKLIDYKDIPVINNDEEMSDDEAEELSEQSL